MQTLTLTASAPPQAPTRIVYRPCVIAEMGLKCLLGQPAACLWDTVITGYRADVRREESDGHSEVWLSRDFANTEYDQAKRWADKSAADLNRNRY